MNTSVTAPKPITTAAPAGETPAVRTAQNITVGQRASMNSRERTGQGASAPSTPATPRVAATSTPATAGTPNSEAAAPSQPGTEPNAAVSAAADPASAPAHPEPAATPSDALANAAGNEGADTSPQPSPQSGEGEDGSGLDGVSPHQQQAAGEAHLNGEAPEWLSEILNGDATKVPHAIKQMAKRISQLTYELRTAETALAQAGGEPPAEPGTQNPERGTNPSPTAPAAAPAGTEFQQVQAQLDHAWKVVEWCEQNRNGGSITLKDGSTQEFSAEEVATQLVTSQRNIKDLDKQATQIEQAAQARFANQWEKSKAEAFQKFPWMKDRSSAESREAAAYLDANPHLQRDPNWPVLVGRYVTGLIAERKGTTTATTPPVAAPMQRPRANGQPAPVPAGPTSQAPRVDPQQAELATLRAEYRKTGSVKIKERINALERRMSAPRAAA